MIDAIATRWTNFQGKLYAKGDTVPMPLQQFQDLEPTGIFKRAPKAKADKAPSKPDAKPVAIPSDEQSDKA